jgi:long-chain acyl-CoA synthetase
MNVAQLLEKYAQTSPDKTAINFREQAVTYQQLKGLSFSLAHSLIHLGIKKGEKVAIYLPNSPEYIYSYLAVWLIGATAVPLDFMLTEDELVSCITHAQAQALIAKSKPAVSLSSLKEKCPSLKEVISCNGRTEGLLFFDELTKEKNDKAPGVEIGEKDHAIIFYTSGTTGKPKGVLINYQQLDASPKAFEYFVNSDIKGTDKTLCALPFSHLGGLIYIQAILSFNVGVVLTERFIPSDFLAQVARHMINWFWLVPSMYYAFLQLKEFESFDLSSLRWLVIFGAPSSPDALRRFHAHCPQAVLYHGWGLTETNAPTTVIPTGSDKIESVGKPAPWIEVKIFDDQDKEVPLGQVGEIAVSGWVVTDGYFKDPVLTNETIRNGWFHTGDLGRFDAEGFLYIVGRKKEMIKVAGEIVFEPEVEGVIHKHPEVAEAAVVGIPDKLRGEVPKAFVVLKEGSALSEEQLRYFLREHLAHFKIPHSFEFRTVLPKNRVGKIDKEALRPAR